VATNFGTSDGELIKMKCKITLVIPTLDQGGAEKQLCLLADGLPRDLFETEVVSITRSGPREEWLRERNIPIHFVDKRGKIDPFAWQSLRRHFLETKPDIVHTWLFAANAYGRSAAISAKVPIVVGSERSVDPWKKSWHFWIDRFLAHRTRKITTNSTGVVDFYSKHGIPNAYFSLIPNAVTESTVTAISREEAAQRLGVSPDRKWILSVGRLWHQKGYKDLIWTAETLRVFHENTSYIIIGEGPERARLEQYSDNVRASSQVFIVGERTDVAQILPHAAVLWNGSLYEGQSNVILEAMQNGLPVIASDIPGNRDLVHHRKTGLLFPVGDVDSLARQTNELFRDDSLRASLTAQAQQFVQKNHSLENMVSSHVKLYQQWMKERR